MELLLRFESGQRPWTRGDTPSPGSGNDEGFELEGKAPGARLAQARGEPLRLLGEAVGPRPGVPALVTPVPVDRDPERLRILLRVEEDDGGGAALVLPLDERGSGLERARATALDELLEGGPEPRVRSHVGLEAAEEALDVVGRDRVPERREARRQRRPRRGLVFLARGRLRLRDLRLRGH